MATYIVKGKKTQGRGERASYTLTEHTIKASSEAEAIRLVRWEVEQSHVQSKVANALKSSRSSRQSTSFFPGFEPYWEWQPESVQLKK